MKHVVNFSGGDCSFWALHRVIQKFGRENVIPLFADTLIEDDDLYAFNQRTEELLGVKIVRVSREKTPWQLFRKRGCIGNNLHPVCSVVLKREPLNEWFDSNFAGLEDEFFRESAISYLGFDWTEVHRLTAIREAFPMRQWEAPMQWEPIWDKCRMRREAKALGLPDQKLYKLGFPHNNCGGGCVRAGISHWVHLFRVLPEVFLRWEKDERDCAEYLKSKGIEPLSMLKDRRGGTTKNLYLWQLRERIESGEKLPKHDWGGCGCGGADPTKAKE